MVRLLTLLVLPLLATCMVITPSGLRPVVVITFDDGHESIYTNAFRILSETSPALPATHFLPTEWIDRPGMVTLKQLREMENRGWETGGHASSHVNLPQLSPDSIRQQIGSCFRWLEAAGLRHESFAYPSGKYNDTVLSIAFEYFRNLRTAHDYHYTDGVNRREIGYFAVTQEHKAADIIARIEEAETEGAPLVVIGFHAVLDDNGAGMSGSYYCRESVLRRLVSYLKTREFQVMTIREAMNLLADN
jgi:peptidoglycan/xylan/chitin deacetylase (PgdA/CDA1 family)